jgi:tRNA-Thr(GGU) m(6)t(6)A37 methyltransferase TsaA
VSDETVELRPIGRVRGGRVEATDDRWGDVRSTIVLDPECLAADATTGLETFSHLEVVYLLHLVDEASVETGARHPRDRADWPLVGILAQRAKRRPNRIGVSRCRLLAVDGLNVLVEGLDAVDGTPVLDVKPYLAEFGPIGEVRQPAWSTELMAEYYERSER